MNQHNDISRLRGEYAEREQRFSDSDIYSWFNLSNLFAIHTRQRAVLKALRRQGFTDLTNLKVLEMGCGGGGVMTEFLGFGAFPENLYGIDLLYNRLYQARRRLPGSHFTNADGSVLPFPTGTFDLVLQYTAISSILDADLRRNICADMLRVLQSPDQAGR